MTMILEKEVGRLLKKKRLTIAVAESCTGGLIAHRLTNIPGSSEYFERGIVAYSNRSKTEILKVSKIILKKYGAVSEETARAMAKGIRDISGTSLGLSVTGIAGPGGGSKDKPIGTVFIALASRNEIICKQYHLKGRREEIKSKSSEKALELLYGYLRDGISN